MSDGVRVNICRDNEPVDSFVVAGCRCRDLDPENMFDGECPTNHACEIPNMPTVVLCLRALHSYKEAIQYLSKDFEWSMQLFRYVENVVDELVQRKPKNPDEKELLMITLCGIRSLFYELRSAMAEER